MERMELEVGTTLRPQAKNRQGVVKRLSQFANREEEYQALALP
jgi:hypothetical protein